MQTERPHRRYNPLTGEWVLVSPQRNNRPWQGASEAAPDEVKPAYDPSCYLCPGNTRVTGDVNPDYSGPYVFPNDFPALLVRDGDNAVLEEGLFRAHEVSGEARVICYSERHDLPMARLKEPQIEAVIRCWKEQYADLSQHHEYVTIFENKGAAMGCSNPHPHGQIWASGFVPSLIDKEDRHQRQYWQDTGRSLLNDYLRSELSLGERIVVRTEYWAAVIPYWAGWPFEAMVLPFRHIARMDDLDDAEINDLAKLLKQLTVKYDNIFKTEFPYSMGWHGAPCQMKDTSHWCLHAHFYPPLLRSATVRKFMVGFELLAETQRDLTPETAAEIMRNTETRHYLEMGA